MTQPNAKLVEVARAIGEVLAKDERACWDRVMPEAARAAIRALMEPSEDMVEAGVEPWLEEAWPHDIYRAMLAKVLEE